MLLGAAPALADCDAYCTPGPPTATTDPATGVSNTGATLPGKVNPNGVETTYSFEFGETTGYGSRTAPRTVPVSGVPADYEEKAVSEAITGLKPNTTYHFRLVADNAASADPGVAGGDRTFTTPPDAEYGLPPSVVTGIATDVLSGSATLNGTVNPSGQPTQYGFQYGTTTGYGTYTTAAPVPGAVDATDHPVSAAATGLAPGTTYHFRIVAGNATGLVFGQDQTFTTAGVAPGRLAPALTLRTRPRRDRKAPYAYRATGRLRLPPGVSRAQGCTGRITVRIRRGRRPAGTATVALRSNCRYAKRIVATRGLPRSSRRGRLTIRASFGGNDALLGDRSGRRIVGYG